MVPLFKPKETLLALPKVTPPNWPVVVPALIERFAAAAVFADIVTELPFWERVTLLPPARNSVPLETSDRTPAVLPPKDALIPPPPPPPPPMSETAILKFCPPRAIGIASEGCAGLPAGSSDIFSFATLVRHRARLDYRRSDAVTRGAGRLIDADEQRYRSEDGVNRGRSPSRRGVRRWQPSHRALRDRISRAIRIIVRYLYRVGRRAGDDAGDGDLPRCPV